MNNPIASALGWIEGTVLGTVATAVAVIAFAWIGFLMLSGRIDLRRAALVIFGCFIIFGAESIAAGLHGAIFGTPHSMSDQVDVAPPTPAYPAASVQAAPSTYDPYAGAALPPPPR